MPAPTKKPVELSRIRYKTKNIKHAVAARKEPIKTQTTEKQKDIKRGRILVPDQIADKGRYRRRYPPPDTVLASGHIFH